MAKRRCSAKTKKGTRCKTPPMKDSDTCIAHADKQTKASKGFGGVQPGGGRPPAPRAVDVLRERIERDIDVVVDPLFDALSADTLVWAGERDAESVPDHKTRIAASRELLDRGYGRPKQETEISSPGGGAIVLVAPVDATAKSRRAAALLKGVGQVDAPG